MANTSQIRLICVFSGIVGGLIAIPAFIPPLTGLALIALTLLTAPFIILYLKKLGIIKQLEPQKCTVVGAISGAAASVGFCIIYIPIAFLLNLMFKVQSYIGAKVLFTNFTALIFFTILIALTVAMFNAFSGFLTAQIYNIIYGNRG